MNLVKWALGVRREAPRRRGVVLRLTCCEDRIVPDGPGDPPPGGGDPGGQESGEQQAYTATLEVGEWGYVGRTGGQDFLLTLDADGRLWLFAFGVDSPHLTAVLLNYDGSYDPAASPLVRSDFAPDPGRWNMVWDPDRGTWATAAPATVFPGSVRGFVNGDWNMVLLTGQNPPPPVNPPPPPAGGVTVTVTVGAGEIRIEVPPGSSVTITPTPGGGANIQVNGPGGPRPVIPANPPAGQPPLPQAPPPRPAGFPLFPGSGWYDPDEWRWNFFSDDRGPSFWYEYWLDIQKQPMKK